MRGSDETVGTGASGTGGLDVARAKMGSALVADTKIVNEQVRSLYENR